MESSELYHVKQQFTLGAYKSLVDLTLPDPNSPDYNPTLLYKARAYIALDDPANALNIIPSDTENLALKAATSLAKLVQAETSGADKDPILEEFRDLSVEIEGDDIDADEKEKGWVRVLAGTAFARAGEIEEALETLSVVQETQNLEGVAVLAQIYLSINRPDLAQKEFNVAKQWAEDDILLQLIESSISLVTGKDAYSDPASFYTEQLANPSLTSPHLLTARGVTRLLRGEISAAKSDLEEAVSQQGGKPDKETLAALTVAFGVGNVKQAEAEEYYSQLKTQHPRYQLVDHVEEKAATFDELAARFDVPPLASVAA
ncbi:hypothetical protein K474DRAFT_1593499 [Panus rudis PR-1116 ss-1]|nr:hypothetical protein K474DRAFT_1593499 [Panus rudis PR-1116 ss-1]